MNGKGVGLGVVVLVWDGLGVAEKIVLVALGVFVGLVVSVGVREERDIGVFVNRAPGGLGENVLDKLWVTSLEGRRVITEIFELIIPDG